MICALITRTNEKYYKLLCIINELQYTSNEYCCLSPHLHNATTILISHCTENRYKPSLLTTVVTHYIDYILSINLTSLTVK